MARLVLSVVALCLFATVLPGVLSQKCRKGGLCPQSDNLDDEVWLIHFGPADSRQEYVDPLTGEVKGFLVDIVNAVCEIADKDCRIVYDLQNNCWDSVDGQAVGGFGVFNSYYDGCMGWLPTYPRLRTFQFTDSHSQNVGSGFIVPAGNPEGFDSTDLTGKNIGFIQGFFTDPACIAREGDDITGAELSSDQILFYGDPVSLRDAILNGEVDAGVDASFNYQNQDELDYLNDDSPIECAASGPALMTRKDNLLKAWWDPALNELLGSDKYEEICDGIETEHGDKPGPAAADICLSPPAK